jgi:hypothetical protein
MPYSLAGDAPYYPGEIFSTKGELLTIVKDFVSDPDGCNWSITDDHTASPDFFFTAKATYDPGGGGDIDELYFTFAIQSVAGVPGKFNLSIRGDIAGTGANLSPDTIKLSFIENSTGPAADNSIWMAGDASWINMCIMSNTSETKGIYAGFYDKRIKADDSFAAGLGYLDNRLDSKYIAQDFLATNYWVRADAFWYFKEHYTNLKAPLQGLLDLYTTCIANEYTLNTNFRLPGFQCQNGQVNGVDQKPVMGYAFLLEGKANDTSGYKGEGNKSSYFFFRGVIPNTYTGANSFAATTKYTDSEGNRYLVSGDLGWMCFRIVFAENL